MHIQVDGLVIWCIWCFVCVCNIYVYMCSEVCVFMFMCILFQGLMNIMECLPKLVFYFVEVASLTEYGVLVQIV